MIKQTKMKLVDGLRKPTSELLRFFPNDKKIYFERIKPIPESPLDILYGRDELKKIREVLGFKAIKFSKRRILIILSIFKDRSIINFINEEKNREEERIKLVAEMGCYLMNKKRVISSIQVLKRLHLERFISIITGFLPSLKSIKKEERFTALLIFMNKLKYVDRNEAILLQIKYAINPERLLR